MATARVRVRACSAVAWRARARTSLAPHASKISSAVSRVKNASKSMKATLSTRPAVVLPRLKICSFVNTVDHHDALICHGGEIISTGTTWLPAWRN